MTLKTFAIGTQPSAFPNTMTAGYIAEATAVSYFGRKDMQQHNGLDTKANFDINFERN